MRRTQHSLPPPPPRQCGAVHRTRRVVVVLIHMRLVPCMGSPFLSYLHPNPRPFAQANSRLRDRLQSARSSLRLLEQSEAELDALLPKRGADAQASGPSHHNLALLYLALVSLALVSLAPSWAKGDAHGFRTRGSAPLNACVVVVRAGLGARGPVLYVEGEGGAAAVAGRLE